MSGGTDPIDQRLPLALRDVLAMHGGAVAVPLMIGRAVGLPPEQMALPISADPFARGLVAIVQSPGFPGVGVRCLSCRG